MPRINPNSCCGFFTVTGLNISPENLDEWLRGTFANSVERHRWRNYNFPQHSSGKMYQCIYASDQWSPNHHEIMKNNGWKMVSSWSNSSGSLLRAYQYITPGAEREVTP